MESREGQATRLKSLDTLRGVAILLVFFFHASIDIFGRQLGGRGMAVVANQGVQLFFLVSAYTMCVMWAARAGESNKALKFYIRRLCRIAPLYWLAILIYGLLNGFKPLGDIVANSLLLHAWIPTAINSVVPGGWSIGVEIFFYMLFPLVIALPRNWIMPSAFLWYLVAGVVVEERLSNDSLFLYYSPLTQLPVFAVGIFVFEALNRPDRRVLMIGLLTAALWLTASFVLKRIGFEGRPFFWVGIAFLAAAMTIVVRCNISVPLVRWMGTISYSMYLSHFGVLAVFTSKIGGAVPGYVTFMLALAVTCAVSWVSFKTAENWSQLLARLLVRRLDEGRKETPVSA